MIEPSLYTLLLSNSRFVVESYVDISLYFDIYVPVILSISSAWIKIIQWKNAIDDIRCITQLARSTSQLNRYDVKFSTNFFKRRIAKMAKEFRVLFSFHSRESPRRSRVNYYPLMLQRCAGVPGGLLPAQTLFLLPCQDNLKLAAQKFHSSGCRFLFTTSSFTIYVTFGSTNFNDAFLTRVWNIHIRGIMWPMEINFSQVSFP